MEVPQLRHLSTANIGSAPQRAGSLREATEEFESLFVSQVVRAMRQTVPESGLMGLNDGQRLFRDLLDGELARHIAHSSEFGIGEALYQELTRDA
jgi:Rod binding domain-containing protein